MAPSQAITSDSLELIGSRKDRWSAEINVLLAFRCRPTRGQLQTMQKSRCYWCQQSFKGDMTLEHVVRRSSAVFMRLRPQRALAHSLRLSHRPRNLGYAIWAQQYPNEVESEFCCADRNFHISS